ncbi:Anti-sigma-B factor antagonist [compost metagenome]
MIHMNSFRVMMYRIQFQERVLMNLNRNEKFTAIKDWQDEHCTVYLQGELDLAAAPEFRKLMEPIIGDDKLNLRINLKDLKYIDSTGIGILLSILKARHGMNSSFVVEEVPAQIQKLFSMTGISKFFAV